jgi:hypothetical protein
MHVWAADDLESACTISLQSNKLFQDNQAAAVGSTWQTDLGRMRNTSLHPLRGAVTTIPLVCIRLGHLPVDQDPSGRRSINPGLVRPGYQSKPGASPALWPSS